MTSNSGRQAVQRENRPRPPREAARCLLCEKTRLRARKEDSLYCVGRRGRQTPPLVLLPVPQQRHCGASPALPRTRTLLFSARCKRCTPSDRRLVRLLQNTFLSNLNNITQRPVEASLSSLCVWLSCFYSSSVAFLRSN